MKRAILRKLERESRAVAESPLCCISSGSGFNLLTETPILMSVRDHVISIILQLNFNESIQPVSFFCYPTRLLQLLNTWANFNKTGHMGEVSPILCSYISQNQGRWIEESSMHLLGQYFQSSLSFYVPETTSVSPEESKCHNCKKISSSYLTRDIREPSVRTPRPQTPEAGLGAEPRSISALKNSPCSTELQSERRRGPENTSNWEEVKTAKDIAERTYVFH